MAALLGIDTMLQPPHLTLDQVTAEVGRKQSNRRHIPKPQDRTIQPFDKHFLVIENIDSFCTNLADFKDVFRQG